MAAGPALHIFPPIEQVNRRKESLDHLIRRSMDMRPTGPFVPRNDGHSPTARHKATRGRNGSGQSPSDSTPAINIKAHDDNTRTTHKVESAPIPLTEEALAKATAFQMLPPIQVPKSSSSRPRRSSSVTERQRLVPASNLAQRRAKSPNSAMRQKWSPVTPNNDDQITTPASAQSSGSTPVSPPERNIPSGASNRHRVVYPNRNGGEVASFYTPGTQMPLERYVSSRASNRSRNNALIQRQTSRASSRTRAGYPVSPESKRSATPSIHEAASARSASPTLVRSNSAITHRLQTSPNEYEKSERLAPVQSMFPVYDPSLPLAEQYYQPTRSVAPLAMIAPGAVSKPEYSPTLQQEFSRGRRCPVVTATSDLQSLWNTANGSMATPEPRTYNLKMTRPDMDQKKQKITFSSSESKTFYSLSKSHPASSDEDEYHELLLSRHHTTKDDILPISHLQLQPPPPPTISKYNRGSVISDIHEPASHITTISPILATLHSLDHAAKTPQAHTLALVDPNATSPAAARLAERAVAEATARESCTLTWTPTCPRTGKYELHHPSLGVFSVVTNGDVGSALESGFSRLPASISIVNPFANMTPLTTSPSSLGSTSSSKTAVNEMERDGAIIARLNLQDDVMFIDAAAIQQLGNLYLTDVCVSTLVAVAVAEAKRPADPGLVFAAPPPSLLNISIKSKKMKAPKEPKPLKEPKKPKKNRPQSMGLTRMSIDHLIAQDDLPRITRGVLSVLGFSFKSAVWLLAFMLKISAGMVVSISKIATSENL